MKKNHYEQYTQEIPTILVREKVNETNLYTTKYQSILNTATGFIQSNQISQSYISNYALDDYVILAKVANTNI